MHLILKANSRRFLGDVVWAWKSYFKEKIKKSFHQFNFALSDCLSLSRLFLSNHILRLKKLSSYKKKQSRVSSWKKNMYVSPGGGILWIK